METTKNYNFEKPDAKEVLEMGYLNRNIDSIDESLKDLDDKITEHSSSISHIPYAIAAGSANSYEVTVTPAPTAYVDGMAVCVKVNETSTGASTLNVNGLGAKAIKDCYGNEITSEGLKVNTPYIMRYESVSQSFIVQGKGGGGNATADQILDGVKATVDSGPITGTMPNNGAISKVLDINENYTIPKGYHDGSGKITQNIPTKAAETYIPGITDQIITAGQYLSGDQTIQGDADLITDNIKAGTSIFGIKGKDTVVDTADATAVEGEVIKGKTAYVNGAKVTGTMQDNGAAVIKPGTSDQTIPEGYHNGKGYVEGDIDLKPENIKAGVNIFGVEGKSSIVETSDGTATENEILDGYTAYVDGAKVTGVMPNNGAVSKILDINGSYTIPKGYHDGTGKVNQSIPTKGAATYKPGTSNQTIASGQYLSGDQTIIGDANLITGNIKSGVNIFGVPGKESVVDTADATAVSGDMLSGKTAYINGSKKTGTIPNNGGIIIKPALHNIPITTGYHNGNGYVEAANISNLGGFEKISGTMSTYYENPPFTVATGNNNYIYVDLPQLSNYTKVMSLTIEGVLHTHYYGDFGIFASYINPEVAAYYKNPIETSSPQKNGIYIKTKMGYPRDWDYVACSFPSNWSRILITHINSGSNNNLNITSGTVTWTALVQK